MRKRQTDRQTDIETRGRERPGGGGGGGGQDMMYFKMQASRDTVIESFQTPWLVLKSLPTEV